MTNKDRSWFVVWMLFGVLVLLCAAVDFLLRCFGMALFGLLSGIVSFWSAAGTVGRERQELQKKEPADVANYQDAARRCGVNWPGGGEE